MYALSQQRPSALLSASRGPSVKARSSGRTPMVVAASGNTNATTTYTHIVDARAAPRPGRAQEAYSLAAAAPAPAAEAVSASTVPEWLNPTTLGAAAAVAVAAMAIKKIFDTPSRAYDENVGDEYDAWTEEGVLEYYWGEHIHLGYYNEKERAKGAWSAFKKDFIQAKYDFVDEMYKWSEKEGPAKILDVGCGIGGTSRHLAAKLPDASVTGITLSPKQVARGMQLAKERGLDNVELKVMDALKMEFEDNTFDFVWACESGEHMPDKKAYVEEMVRVLKPGGRIVIACWCQREETPENPLTEEDKKNLTFLYEEWAHPYFVSKEEFGRLMEGTGKMEKVSLADWCRETIDSWRHSIWVGVVDPWFVVMRPHIWYKTVREIVTLERMHRAFDRGLMEYGMMKGMKKA